MAQTEETHNEVNTYGYTGTYSPDDNKLRLYATKQLDPETYQRVKAAGFIWAPKQDLFVAPMWTPQREDLLRELCGEIDDEDTRLAERAEERADRFQDYRARKEHAAEQARQAVHAIADHIPFGQPILVGHHSEAHARQDAERIRAGMRKAVENWRTATYWQQRAKAAIEHAKYKERPDVRARRIKGLEADLHKQHRTTANAEQVLALWTNPEKELTLARATAIANHDDISVCFTLEHYPRDHHLYEGPSSVWAGLTDGIITAQQARDLSVPVHQRRIAHAERWLAHIENRLAYERAMWAGDGGTVAERKRPEKGGGCKCWASPRGGWSYIQKVNKISVTIADTHGNGGRTFTHTIPFDELAAVMSQQEVEAQRAAGVFMDTADKIGFFLREHPAEAIPEAARAKCTDQTEHAAAFATMQETLTSGIQVVTVPQLFPTPRALAERMVQLADIQPGMRVLEPSVGTGARLKALDEARGDVSDREPPLDIVAVEINPQLAAQLPPRLHGTLHCADFLTCGATLGTFERIVMNPPFHNGADIALILHARTMLTPGGRLVALCANGSRQQDRLRPLADTWEPLPTGTFHEQGTGVPPVLLTMRAQTA